MQATATSHIAQKAVRIPSHNCETIDIKEFVIDGLPFLFEQRNLYIAWFSLAKDLRHGGPVYTKDGNCFLRFLLTNRPPSKALKMQKGRVCFDAFKMPQPSDGTEAFECRVYFKPETVGDMRSPALLVRVLEQTGFAVDFDENEDMAESDKPMLRVWTSKYAYEATQPSPGTGKRRIRHIAHVVPQRLFRSMTACHYLGDDKPLALEYGTNTY